MKFIGRLFLGLILISNLGYGISYAADDAAVVNKTPVHRSVPPAAPVIPPPASGNGTNGNGANGNGANGNGAPTNGQPKSPLKIGEKPLIPPKVIQSTMTAEQAIPRVYVTAPYETSFPDIVETGADGGFVAAQLSTTFRTGTGSFAQFKGKKKWKRDHHYELGDPLVTDATIAEVKDPNYSKVYVVNDFNTALNTDSSEITTNEFNRLIKAGLFKDNAEGRELKRLLDATQGSWEVFGSDNLYSKRKTVSKAKLQLFSQPVFGKFDTEEQKAKGKPIEMRPIDHNKETVWGIVDDKSGEEIPVIGYSGGVNQTLPANAVTDPKTGMRSPMYRVNSMYLIAEPNILQNMVDNSQAMMDSFGDGLGIKGIKPVQPVQANLADGGSILLDYTYGVINPNIIWVDILNDAITTFKTDNKIPLDKNDLPAQHHTEIVKSFSAQFDISYKPQLQAEERYMALKTPAIYVVYSDAQFSRPGGYGFSPVYADFPLDRTMGGQLRDFAHAFARDPNFSINVFFATIPGIKRTKASDDPTDVILLHAKDQDAEIIRDGLHLFHGEWGSFNRSGHEGEEDGQVGNFESRLVVELPIQGRLAQAMMERTPKMMDVQKQMGRVFTGVEFLSMAYIADLTGKLLENIDINDVRQIMQMIQAAQKLKSSADMEKAYGQVLDKIQAIFDAPASVLDPQTGKREVIKLDKPMSKDKFDASMTVMRNTFEWYSQRAVPQTANGNGLFVPQFWTLLEHVRQPGEDALETKEDFDASLFRSWVTPDQLTKDIAGLWAKSGITKPIPADFQPQNGAKPEVNTASDVKSPTEVVPQVPGAVSKVSDKSEKPEIKKPSETKVSETKAVETKPAVAKVADVKKPLVSAKSEKSDYAPTSLVAQRIKARLQAKLPGRANARSVQEPSGTLPEVCKKLADLHKLH